MIGKYNARRIDQNRYLCRLSWAGSVVLPPKLMWHWAPHETPLCHRSKDSLNFYHFHALLFENERQTGGSTKTGTLEEKEPSDWNHVELPNFLDWNCYACRIKKLPGQIAIIKHLSDQRAQNDPAMAITGAPSVKQLHKSRQLQANLSGPRSDRRNKGSILSLVYYVLC